MNPVRIALIGTGSIAGSHLRAVQSVGGRAALVAAVDIDRDRVEAFCRGSGTDARAYTDVAAMLVAEQPDLVQIATPPGSHAALAIQCMEAGAWVLCEKPLCGSLAELDAIEEAERRTGRFCSSVFQWRFGSAAQHLKALIAAGALGRPLLEVCNTTWYRDEAYYAPAWRGTWEGDLGGPTMIQGIHTMDLLLWLMGDWTEARAMIASVERPIAVEDVSLAQVRFASGAVGSIVNSVLSPRQETRLRLDCHDASVEATFLYAYTDADWQITPAPTTGGAAAVARWQAKPAAVASTHGAQLVALLDSMARGEQPLVSGPEARRTIAFVTALYKAAVTGAPVYPGTIRADDPFYTRISGTAGAAGAAWRTATPGGPATGKG